MLKRSIVRKGLVSVLTITLFSATILMGERRADERVARLNQRIVKESITPLQMNYQGYLASSTDTTGVTGTYSIIFRLYTQESGGSPVWVESHGAVQIDKGVFNVYLGEVIPIPDTLFNGNPLWLEIQVEADVLLPRKKIVSVGYSIRSQFTDSAHCATTAVGVGVPLDLSGSVSSPNAILTVENTGTGDGVYVRDAGKHGVCVGTAGDNGFWVNKAGDKGLVVDNAGDDGVWVGNAGGDGIHVEHADNWAGYFSGKAYVSDRIGIGTTDPTGELHIKSNDPGIKFEESDQGNKMWAIWGSNSGLMFSEAGVANRLYIKEGGNVGIGTTSPGSHKLYVKSSGSGVSGATAYIENTHTNGLALIVEATSNDLPLLVSQKGNGPILRCDSWTGGWHPVFKVENDGTTTCSVLQLTGGSDLSEQFDIKATEGEVKPGMLVCIDPEHPGELIVSTKAYDHKVAGIISGAGGVEPGMLMGQRGSKANGSHPVALTGRVYCWADASFGKFQPGDLLTTSSTPGHAMKVTDYATAQGAIIGKAMSSLEEGKGLILVLVTLQ